MPRYIDADKLIRHLKDEHGKCTPPNDDRQGEVAYGAMLGLKMAISYAETLSTADVVPRDEVAKIFEEIESVLFTVANPCPSADGTIKVKHSKDFHLRREDYYTIKEKYTKGGEGE